MSFSYSDPYEAVECDCPTPLPVIKRTVKNAGQKTPIGTNFYACRVYPGGCKFWSLESNMPKLVLKKQQQQPSGAGSDFRASSSATLEVFPKYQKEEPPQTTTHRSEESGGQKERNHGEDQKRMPNDPKSTDEEVKNSSSTTDPREDDSSSRPSKKRLRELLRLSSDSLEKATVIAGKMRETVKKMKVDQEAIVRMNEAHLTDFNAALQQIKKDQESVQSFFKK